MKSNLAKVYKYFDSKFPFEIQEAWDKSGLNFGDKRRPLTGVVVATDLTKAVFDKAMQMNASLIVLHHPFIFEDETTDIINAPYKKELLHRIKNTGIGVITLHTNYDKAESGMINTIKSELKWPLIERAKYGGLFKINNISLNGVSEHLEKTLAAPIKSTNVQEETILNKVALIPGAGSIEEILAYKAMGADLVITSDIKWSTWVTCSEENINLAQVTHGIEEIFAKHIARLLKRNFKDIEVCAM